MKLIPAVLKYWLPLAAGITLLSGLLYITVQQSLRYGANFPQVQLAEDVASAMQAGQSADSLIPPAKVDIATSLAPYLIVFDKDGNLLASNGSLNGSTPVVPSGVFDYVRAHGEDRISWQPTAGVRSAAVIAPVSGGKGGFVLAGRSLREVEKLIDMVTTYVSAGWLGTLLATLVLVVLLELFPFTRSRKTSDP